MLLSQSPWIIPDGPFVLIPGAYGGQGPEVHGGEQRVDSKGAVGRQVSPTGTK